MNGMRAMSFADSIAPDQLLAGRYRVIRTLAPGSQAKVFVACDQKRNDAQVVIKQLDSSVRGGYLREAAAGMDMEHPRIVRPIDTFYLGDTVGCLVYEYFADGTLRDWLEKNRHADRAIIRQLMQDLLSALAYLHERRLIHCDIKPDNLFLRSSHGGLQCFLGDLGATCTVREAKEGKHRTGSPAYTAPERFYDKFHFNSDLYSVGVLCFELATGALPFFGTPAEITRAHLHEAPPLHRIESTNLRDFVACLMEKDPVRRVATAERALAILSNPAFQTNRDLKPGPTPSAANAEAQKVVGRQNLKVVWQGAAPYPLEGLLLFHDGRRPVVVFDHGSDLSIFSDPAVSPRVLAKSGRAQALCSHKLAYGLQNRLSIYDLKDGSRTVLHEQTPGLLAFAVSGQVLAWRTRRAVHLHDRALQTELNWVCNHYLLEPQLALLADGHVAVSSGPMNSEIQIRDTQGKAIRTLELDGPVMGMTADRRAALVLTMDMGHKDRYAVWRVSEFAAPEKLSLPAGVRHWCFTPGHLFWVDDDGQVQQLGLGLNQRTVFHGPTAISALALSSDHSYAAVVHMSDSGAQQVIVYQT